MTIWKTSVRIQTSLTVETPSNHKLVVTSLPRSVYALTLEIKGRLPMHLEIQGSWAPAWPGPYLLPAGAVPSTSASHRDLSQFLTPPGLPLHQGIHSACYAAELCGCPHTALGLSSNLPHLYKNTVPDGTTHSS